jgi:predicted dehydrogenase
MQDLSIAVCLQSPAKLEIIVEPWFMSTAGTNSPGYDEFIRFKTNLEQTGVKFFATVKEVPPADEGIKRLAIISARTADNPKLFADCLKVGCHSIFLEKPGAPSLAELENMMNDAQNAGVNVFMGFNKNVSKYVAKTRQYEAKHPGVKVTYVHNNNYEDSEASLGECFERNAEGMLKNMAIHELALVVTYYGVTVDSVASVEADKEFSSCKSLKGPSGGVFTDFDKLKFAITTKEGKVISILADRCGGDDSVGIATDADGKELVRFTMPDGEDATQIENAEKRVPGAMPYFYMQDPDYSTLKQRVAKAMLDGSKPKGVATIDVAVDSLKLAEYLTPILQKQLL